MFQIEIALHKEHRAVGPVCILGQVALSGTSLKNYVVTLHTLLIQLSTALRFLLRPSAQDNHDIKKEYTCSSHPLWT